MFIPKGVRYAYLIHETRLRWDLAARFPRFPGVEFQGRKIVKNSPLVDAYRTETAHDKGADSRIILVRFWY